MPAIRRSSGQGGLGSRACGSPRSPGSGSPKEPAVYVMQHEGATRIVHQPDGTIVCEPASPHGPPLSPRGVHAGDEDDPAGVSHLPLLRNLAGTAAGKAVDLAGDALKAIVVLGGITGFLLSTCQVLSDVADTSIAAHRRGENVHVVRMATRGAQAIVLSTITGGIVAPASAALGLARMALRPALLGMAIHSSVCWLRRHHLGAAALLRKLQSAPRAGDLVKQLDALRRIVARLSTSAAFAAQFKRLAGVETLLRMLEDLLEAAQEAGQAVPGPAAPLCASALAVLATQGDAADTLVELDGVPLLLRAASVGLAGTGSVIGGVSARALQSPGAASLLVHSMAALARVTSKHAVAQQILASEPGAAPLVVSVLESATARSVRGATPDACDELRGYSVALAQALALEPAAKAELGAAGGVEALSAALVVSVPWSVGQAAAASALHTLVRGDPGNQRRLAAVSPAGLSAAIHRALVTGSGASGAGGVGSGAAGAPGSPAPSAKSGLCKASKSMRSGCGSAADVSVTGWGVLSRPLAPEECHAHRADLLALSNVVARYAAPPSLTVSEPASSLASSPRATPAPVPAPARNATFLSRLGLRTARPAAQPATMAPPPPVATFAPALAPEVHAVEDGADVLAAGSGAPAAPVSDHLSADLDWEQDLGAPDQPEKPAALNEKVPVTAVRPPGAPSVSRA